MFNSLPTDNLYKFFALSGLVLILGSTYYYTTYVDSIKTTITELKVSQKKLEYELNEFESLLDRRNHELNTKEKAINDLYEYSDSLSAKNIINKDTLILYGFKYYSPLKLAEFLKEKTQKTIIELRANANELEAIKKKINFSLYELEGKQELSSYNINRLVIFSILCVSGFGIGCYLTWMGFKKWATIQKIQDKILEDESRANGS